MQQQTHYYTKFNCIQYHVGTKYLTDNMRYKKITQTKEMMNLQLILILVPFLSV